MEDLAGNQGACQGTNSRGGISEKSTAMGHIQTTLVMTNRDNSIRNTFSNVVPFVSINQNKRKCCSYKYQASAIKMRNG